jgi:hypothetical protein
VKRIAICAALVLAPSVAHADDCIGAYEATQTLRKDGKLMTARKEAALCARAECPAILARDCSKWIGELDASIPTVVLDARSPKGAEVADVHVKLDGMTLVEKIDGKAIQVDPGAHTFVFEVPGSAAVEKSVVVREGEKNRRISATIATSSSTPAPSKDDGVGAIPLGVWIFGGVSVAALATSAIFAIDGLGRKSDLDACKPHCSPDDVDAMNARFTFADVALGAGVMAGAAALWLYVTRGDQKAREVVIGPTGVTGRF